MDRRAANDLFLLEIDDYYDDPYGVREFALSCDFDRPFTGTWNGLHSLQRHPAAREVFFDLASRIPEQGRPNWDEIEGGYQFWGRPSAGLFGLLLEGQQDTVHFHRRTGTWAGVCYLSLPQQCAGRRGVVFYRHKETGAASCKGATLEQIELFRRDANYRDRWKAVAAVDLVFNRMAVFDGRFFHAASDGFGRTPVDGRLTQLFNIDFRPEE